MMVQLALKILKPAVSSGQKKKKGNSNRSISAKIIVHVSMLHVIEQETTLVAKFS